MSKDRDSTSAARDESPENRRFSVGRVMSDVLERLQRNLLRNMAVFVGVVTAVIGLAVAAQYLTINRPAGQRDLSLSEALAQLDAGFVEQARDTAVLLRQGELLAEEEQGGAAYVLGVAMVYDAEQRIDPNERAALYLLAARYLEEAESQGYPSGREAHGQLLLGKSRFEAGHFSASLAPLQKALALQIEDSTTVHYLLAQAYLRDSTPQPAKALEHIQQYLSDSSIDTASREAALLTGAEIQFRLGNTSECRQMLAELPAGSRSQADGLLMEGRMLLDEGERAQAESTPAGDDRAAAKYGAALEAFVGAQHRDPGNEELVRKAQYLQGLAHRKLQEYQQAAERLTRTYRSNYDTPEGLAAGFEAAEVLRLLGQDDEAIEAYGRVLRQALDMPVYSNPWIPLQTLQERSANAFRDYLRQAEFERAIQMANAVAPLLSTERALELQAQAHGGNAQHLQEQIDSGAVPNPAMQKESHAAWRRAAAIYQQLAGQRFATRQYPQLLWNSAESYLKGHDYRRAARLLRSYLRNQIRRHHPPALTALGEATLALGLAEEALEPLTECIEFFPRDPHIYRARLLAAEANVELDQLQRAKDLLIDNLENGDLTPRSPDWRESLYALGKVHYREGMQHEAASRLNGVYSNQTQLRKAGLKSLELAQESFQQSVERLSEAVMRDELRQRDRFAAETLEGRYLIAEAYRQIAKLPLRIISGVSIETTRNDLNAEIQQQLTKSADAYLSVQRALNEKQESLGLSSLEEKRLRNTYFSRADVLYDLKRYNDAIDAYATATNRYLHEPEALEAYVQIANCHRLQNRHSEARGTLEQAKVVLNRIRPDADFAQTTRYNREGWQRLLDWLTTL